jgi:hypothetical protein
VPNLTEIEVEKGVSFDSTPLIGRIFERILIEGPGVQINRLDELVEKVVDEETDREIENRVPTSRGRLFARYLIPEECYEALCQEIKKVVAGYHFQQQLKRLSGPPN